MEINLSEWTLSGAGGTAESYYHKTNDSIVLKLFTGAATGIGYARHEFDFAKNVEACGLCTPRAIEIVQCGERSGIIYERVLNKKSFSRLCADSPDKIEEYAKDFARQAKALHETKCTVSSIESRAKQMTRISNNIRYSKSIRDKIKRFVEKHPETGTCLHGDLQSGNLISSNGKNYWIDLGAFAYGNPIYDLACMYFFYRLLPGQIYATTILHMNIRQLRRFWDAFIDEYLSDMTKADKEDYIREIKNAVFIFLLYTSDYEDHAGFEGLALKYGLEFVAKFAKV